MDSVCYHRFHTTIGSELYIDQGLRVVLGGQKTVEELADMMLAYATTHTEFYELSAAVATPIIFIVILFMIAWFRKG